MTQPATVGRPAASDGMRYLLTILATSNFAGGLMQRALDPLVPQIANTFAIEIPTAAILSSATAMSFAVAQLPLGAVADYFGKTRLILVCLALAVIGNLLGAFAPSFEVLLTSRIISGMAAGGVFPVATGLVGDLFPVEQRRVAISRVVAGTLTGSLLGASFSGVLGDLVGWRGVLATLSCGTLLVAIFVAWGLRRHMTARRAGIRFSMLIQNYRRILAHPNARLCFFGVFIEAATIHGMNPYVAAFLQQLGEPRLSIAGIVLAGFGIGGLVYGILVTRLLAIFQDRTLMRMGPAVIASQIAIVAFGPPWQVQCLNYMLIGIGFYMLHGGYQLVTSEIVPEARASAVSLQAFCFTSGQTAGPLLYGAGLLSFGKIPTLLIAALVLLAVSLYCAQFLTFQHRNEDEVVAES